MTFKKLEELVQYAKEEKWEDLDNKLIPEIIKTSTTYELFTELYAQSLFEHENENVRDLAATLASKLDSKQLSKEDTEQIYQTLRSMLNDNGPAPRFWASVALIELNLYARDPQYIKAILENAKESGSNIQKDTALKYLTDLGKK